MPVAKFPGGFPPSSCKYAEKLDISYLTQRLSFFALLEVTLEIPPKLRMAYGGHPARTLTMFSPCALPLLPPGLCETRPWLRGM
jgi:hypothetical protein